MKGALIAALPGALFAEAALAHPHTYVEQQILATLYLDALYLHIVIVPSSVEGAEIFAMLDTDGDRHIAVEEATTFAMHLLSKTHVVTEETLPSLLMDDVSISSRDAIVAGHGRIDVRAHASFEMEAVEWVSITPAYGNFSHDWFVQPFYAPEVVEAFPEVNLTRASDGNGITIFSSAK